MTAEQNLPWTALREHEGRIHLVQVTKHVRKIKGLGVLNSAQMLDGLSAGDSIQIGSKSLQILPPRLPEMIRGMSRRAQTISAKDAGFLIAKLGIGAGDRILEAGLGSAGLAMHICRVIGPTGTLVNLENRQEHADVGMQNIERCKIAWAESFPEHHLIIGDIADTTEQTLLQSDSFDAIILDLPEHVPAIEAVSGLLSAGGRIACYCPVTSQLEDAWQACEDAGLAVEWAGELMERQWGRAGKGGMRPVNGPFGHTAFLLIAQRISR